MQQCKRLKNERERVRVEMESETYSRRFQEAKDPLKRLNTRS